MRNEFLFFSSETNPPAGYVLSKIYVPIETNFNQLFSGKTYCDEISSIAIIPVCMTNEWIEKFSIKERKYVSVKRGIADFRLFIDYLDLVNSDFSHQSKLFIKNVEQAICILSERVKSFRKDEFLKDFYQTVELIEKNKNLKPPLTIQVLMDERVLFITKYCPTFIGGSEVDESRILYKIYEELPLDASNSEKEKLFQEKIKKCFHLKSGSFPDWLEAPEWPISSIGKPMRFVRQKTIKTNELLEGRYIRFYFEDVDTGEKRVICQSV